MTTDELIAEITSGGFARYDESGLIDYLSLRTWIKAELKRFGSNITNLNEAVITIKDNQGKLPENFWNLNVALKCEPAYVSLIHISEPTRRTPISYAVFCLKKKKKNNK